jgi:chromosome partitioning protein
VSAPGANFLVADGRGSQTEMSRALLLWADFALVPCKASMLEARAPEYAVARGATPSVC